MALPKASIGNSASFQIAGTPFVLETEATKTIDFKYVTRAVTIQSSGSGTANKVSFDGGTTTMTLIQNKVYRLDVKCKQMIITRATGTISVVAELTNVEAGQMGAIVQSNYQWIYGCIDSSASNYNANANASDGTCTYTTPDGLWHLDDNLNQACSSTDISIGSAVDIAYASGKFSNGAVFNGSTSKFNINTSNMGQTDDTNSLHWDGEFTIDMWVKISDVTANMLWFTDGADNTANTNNRFTFGYLGNGGAWSLPDDALTLVLGAGAGTVIVSAADTIVNDTWYHIAITRDSSNKIRIFRDGTGLAMAVGGTSYSSSTGYTHTNAINPNDNNTSSGVGYEVGGIIQSGGAAKFSGMIDEIRIHKGDCLWTADFTPPGVGTC